MNDELDALKAITADLEGLHKQKRRHFAPALVLAVVIVAGSFIAFGLRPDLWSQPPWQIVAQIALWALCLIAFPTIGLGLWFPSRRVRLGLAVGGLLLTIPAATGWPMQGGGAPGGPCMVLVLVTGALLLGIGYLSGAFVQRRSSKSTYWVAAGLALVALNVVTWVCPNTGLLHIAPSHFGGAAILLVLAVIAGTLTHRMGRSDRKG